MHIPDIKQNFLDLWNIIAQSSKDWEIYSNNSLLCLKSPIDCPKLQLCWGIKSQDELKKAYDFFDGKAFGYFEDPSNPLQFNLLNDVKVPLIEMALKESDLKKDRPNRFHTRTAESPKDIELWAKLCSETSGMKYDDVINFMGIAWKAKGGSKCLIAYEQDKPVGCADCFIDSNKLGLISSVGVLESHRKKGIGTEIMYESIKKIFNGGGNVASLYAYESAVDFYKTIGFHKTCNWNFYITKNLSTNHQGEADVF